MVQYAKFRSGDFGFVCKEHFITHHNAEHIVEVFSVSRGRAAQMHKEFFNEDDPGL